MQTMSRPVLSTHVLDISTGKPVPGIFVELYMQRNELWTQWHSTVTNDDGRIQFPFLPESMGAGTYKLKFNVEEYYSRNNKETLYPFVELYSGVLADRTAGTLQPIRKTDILLRRTGKKLRTSTNNFINVSDADFDKLLKITFKTKEGEHYHIPLLLTPYGYSTYRGS